MTDAASRGIIRPDSNITFIIDGQIQAKGEFARHSERTELSRRKVEVDKILLQLLAAEGKGREDHGMKAIEIARLMRDRGDKMIKAASNVASR